MKSRKLEQTQTSTQMNLKKLNNSLRSEECSWWTAKTRWRSFKRWFRTTNLKNVKRQHSPSIAQESS